MDFKEGQSELRFSKDSETQGVAFSAAMEVVAADKTLLESESGKTFILNNTVGEDIVLPAVKAGLTYTFVVGAVFATSNWTVATATALGIINGLASVDNVSILAAAEDSINFAFGAETIGDWITVVCDGTQWIARGTGHASGGITFTS